MPSWQYNEVNGIPVADACFNDSKDEQTWLQRFPRKAPIELHKDGFVTVAVWMPGVASKDRSAPRFISCLRFFTAPVVDGKITLDLGEQVVGPTTAPESLEIPEELKKANEKELQLYAQQLGARSNARMPRPQLLSECCKAIKRNPRAWEELKHRLAENAHRRGEAKAATVGV